MLRRALWSGLLLVAVCALYAIDLGRAPVYLHEAEVLFALHARSIATTAHDTNGRLLPLYFFYSSAKAESELGYRTRPFAESLADAYTFWMGQRSQAA